MPVNQNATVFLLKFVVPCSHERLTCCFIDRTLMILSLMFWVPESTVGFVCLAVIRMFCFFSVLYIFSFYAVWSHLLTCLILSCLFTCHVRSCLVFYAFNGDFIVDQIGDRFPIKSNRFSLSLSCMCVCMLATGLQVNHSCIAIATPKEVIELDVDNLVTLPAWYTDEVEYDLELMRRFVICRLLIVTSYGYPPAHIVFVVAQTTNDPEWSKDCFDFDLFSISL